MHGNVLHMGYDFPLKDGESCYTCLQYSSLKEGEKIVINSMIDRKLRYIIHFDYILQFNKFILSELITLLSSAL